ncbi:RAMP superfamily CRISPR-associated protein [Skermania piniformis]|uniref:CRISPR type III-associated protein domain-containing protein n=1 Tax=Skermania pinensis TaxID=39122 RepID=A0ABX8S9H8_9ACTN|nr:RAMP superfamily CRISPR-associated protein [Skermania piniformis]QXQ14504.1 hypothetical protein KV203_03605 [Skermania piniformis]
MRRLHARYRLTGNLTALSAVHVGGLGPDGTVDLGQVRDGQDRVILPGSSLAGVIRAALGDDLTKWWGHDLTGNPDEDRNAHASRIVVADAPAVGPVQLEIRDGVSIDRVTGAAAERHLYTRYVVPPGTAFEFDLAIDVPDEADNQTAHDLVRQIGAQLAGPGLSVGAATTRGLGRMRLLRPELRRDDLASRVGLLALLGGRSEQIDVTPSQDGPPAGTLRITVPWRALGPVLSKVADDGVSDSFPATARDGTQLRLLIPGSSIKGTLRSHAERIVRTLTGETVTAEAGFVDQLAAAAGLPTIGDLFGEATDHQREAGRRGLLAVHDVTSRVSVPTDLWQVVRANGGNGEGDVEQRRRAFADAVEALNTATEPAGLWFDIASRNAIDRWSGAAADKLLYTALEPYVVGDDVWSDLVLDLDVGRAREGTGASVDALLALLMFVLRDFAEGWLPIGFGTTRGLGSVTADPTEIRFTFHGQSGADHAAELHDRRLHDVLADRELTDDLETAWARTIPAAADR